MQPKKEIRLMGIDDSPFSKEDQLGNEVKIIATIFRGGSYLDGLASTSVEKDGFDSTLKLAEMINSCKWKPTLQAIFLDGIAMAGFNVINVYKLYELTGIPIIIIMRNYPDYEKMYIALRKINMPEKIALIERVYKPKKVDDIHVQHIGIEMKDVMKLLKLTCIHSHIPEPLRAAHIIASGVALGQSSGGA